MLAGAGRTRCPAAGRRGQPGRDSPAAALPKPGQAGAWARHPKKYESLGAICAGLRKRKVSTGNVSKCRGCGRNQIQKLKSPILCPHRQTPCPCREPGPQSVPSVASDHHWPGPLLLLPYNGVGKGRCKAAAWQQEPQIHSIHPFW